MERTKSAVDILWFTPAMRRIVMVSPWVSGCPSPDSPARGALHGQIWDLLSHFKWHFPPVEDCEGDLLWLGWKSKDGSPRRALSDMGIWLDGAKHVGHLIEKIQLLQGGETTFLQTERARGGEREREQKSAHSKASPSFAVGGVA